ncbi:MAG: TrkH family potassium uptake protein [Planctomycetes bacterium]|nr:TrkH family potassium uptake protein [Planctomycetota bacterium]
MFFSLPWAHPALGRRVVWGPEDVPGFEWRGFFSLVGSMIACILAAAALYRYGRGSQDRLYRKEAMAIVGLSWVMATVLGALPYYFGGIERGPGLRLMREGEPARAYDFRAVRWRKWHLTLPLSSDEYRAVQALLKTGAVGLSEDELQRATDNPNAADVLHRLAEGDSLWRGVLIVPGEDPSPASRADNFRIRWIRMGLFDSLFESQSGFSTTGATVIADLEDPVLVPHCILFWHFSTHFLGGLGIIVLFVVVLGQGSAGKALMRAEMPGPTKEGATARMQHTAWLFAGIYCALNVVLTAILILEGLTLFDALCHAFGTMATGGFSTRNASVGHFDSPAIEYTIVLFMILAGSNFTLLYFLLVRRQPRRMLRDVEWRVYISIIAGVTLLVVAFGLLHNDFGGEGWLERLGNALRFGLFQVVSILTTTGYGTHDFDRWNSFGRAILFVLMFVGGCAGSTGGGLKVIRHILFLKVLRLEAEQAFRPTVVRLLRLGGEPVEDPGLSKSILVYFGTVAAVVVFSWLFVIAAEPDATWGSDIEHKLIDSASAVAATLNNIGPGLGVVGATQNYGHFSSMTKFLFVWLMMAGRVELFVVLVLFMPRFWRSR